MKKLFTLVLLCLFSQNYLLHAQQDSLITIYEEESRMMDSLDYADPQDYLFMINVPTRSLFKVSLLGNDPSSDFSNRTEPLRRPFLAYERKLSPSFSINAGLSINTYITVGGNSDAVINNIGISLEPRYYLGMSRGIAAGERANNLSGNYLGLQAGYARYRLTDDNFIPDKTGYFLMFNYGIQRRLLKYGFIDIRAGIGTAYGTSSELTPQEGGGTRVSSEDGWQPAVQLGATIGLGFGEGQPEDGRLCNVLLCYEEENQLFKLNVIDLARRVSLHNYSGELDVAYERKLGQSSFSVQLDAGIAYAWGDYGDVSFEEVEWEAGLEPRYYYNLRKRMAQGKSVNNLSANFVALRFSTIERNNTYEELIGDQINTEERTTRINQITPSWGIQRRIFKRGYFSYQLGFSVERYKNTGGSWTNGFAGYSEFQLGFAF